MMAHDGERCRKKGAEGVQDSSQERQHLKQMPELDYWPSGKRRVHVEGMADSQARGGCMPGLF